MANNNLKISIVGTLNVGSTIGEINTQLKGIEKKINKLNISVQVSPQATTAINNLTQQVNNLGRNARNVQNTTNQINNVGNAANQASRHAISLGNAFQQAFTKFPVWILASTAFYAPIQAMESMVSRLIEIDTLMTDIRRVMDMPDFAFTQLLEDAVETSDQLSSKLSDVLKIMGDFGRMGFNESQLVDITKTAQVLQNISDLDATQAVDTLTSAMLNFNIASEDSLTIANKLNNVDNAFAISTKDLSDGIRKAAATAKTFGVDINELTGYIAAIGSTTRESGAIVGKLIAV